MIQVKTPNELIDYVRSIRINGKKLNSTGREQMLASCAFEAYKCTSSGYVRRIPSSGPVPMEIREGFPDSWLEAPHG